MAPHAEWSRESAELASFLNTPKRWARARGLQWDPWLEQRRRAARIWLILRVVENVLLPLPAMGEIVPEEQLLPDSTPSKFQLRQLLEEGGVWPGVRIPLEPPFDVPSWTIYAEGSRSPKEKQALLRVFRQLDFTVKRPWKRCLLCPRVFPADRNTKACPPCRRKWTRGEIQRRFEKARRMEKVIATPVMRLAKHSPPTVRDRVGLCAQCGEPLLETLTEKIVKHGSARYVTAIWKTNHTCACKLRVRNETKVKQNPGLPFLRQQFGIPERPKRGCPSVGSSR